MTENREHPKGKRKKWLLALACASVAVAVLVAEAINRPTPVPLAREYRGVEKAWERVRDTGRVVSCIICDRIDQSRYNGDPLAARVQIQPNGARVIKVTGSFDPEAVNRFELFLEQLGQDRPEWIAFNALGGRYLVAEAIGWRIRKEGLNTMVMEMDVCDSVCMSAFVGGVVRKITDLPYIGGGQFEIVGIEKFNKRKAVKSTQVGIEHLLAYYREMGADPTILEPMIKRDDDNQYRFSAEELKRANVATKVEL